MRLALRPRPTDPDPCTAAGRGRPAAFATRQMLALWISSSGRLLSNLRAWRRRAVEQVSGQSQKPTEGLGVCAEWVNRDLRGVSPIDVELNQLVKTGYIPSEGGGEGRTAASGEHYCLRRRAGRDRIEMKVPADVLDDETVACRHKGKKELEYRPRRTG